jgi:hypothetical protein
VTIIVYIWTALNNLPSTDDVIKNYNDSIIMAPINEFIGNILKKLILLAG